METKNYEVLLKIVETKSFSITAEQLGYTQSSVSHIVKRMEEHLGFQLFNRSRGDVSLTSEGQAFLPSIYELLHAEQKLEQNAAALLGLQKGKLRIGVFTSVSVHLLPEILKEFSKDYPNIQVELEFGDYDEIADALEHGTLDCGFLNVSSSSSLDIIELRHDPLLAVLPLGHPLGRKPSLRFADLVSEPFIMPCGGPKYELGKLISHCESPLNIRYNVPEDYSAIALIKAGLGCSVLPELILTDFKNDVAICKLSDPDAYRVISLGTPSLQKCSLAAKAFLQFVQTNFSA